MNDQVTDERSQPNGAASRAESANSTVGLGGGWRDKPAPTHRCKVCGAMWRYWTKRESGLEYDSWNLRSTVCGPCCDGVEMRDQIEPLTLGEMVKWLAARNAVDAMTKTHNV